MHLIEMQLGYGYWSLPAVEKRIASLKINSPRHWQKKLKRLDELRKKIIEESDRTRLVKGWKGYPKRKERYLGMAKMLRSYSFADVGEKFGVSRQRVHQIVSTWK